MKTKIKIKTGDQVQVIAGSQKGLRGKIIFIDHKKLTAILDTGKERTKSLKNKNEVNKKEKIQTKQIPIPLHLSNLMLWDESLNSIGRITFKIIDNQKKRIFKKSGNLLEERSKIENNKNG